MDSSHPLYSLSDLTLEEFVKFLQFHAFDILSEKVDAIQGKKDVPYKKFVQMHRELPWAQDILNCVSKVCRLKNSYKKLMHDLCRRNMHQLHSVCMNVASSNVLPTKQCPSVQKCCITGKWYENCLDITKNTCSASNQASSVNLPATLQNNWTLISGMSPKMNHKHSVVASSTPSPCTSAARHFECLKLDAKVESTVDTSEPLKFEGNAVDSFVDTPIGKRKSKKMGSMQAKLPKQILKHARTGRKLKQDQRQTKFELLMPMQIPSLHMPPLLSYEENFTNISTSSHPQTTRIYINNQFQHFVHMLWTMSKLELVVKNYTLTWFSQLEGQYHRSTTSKKNVLAKFCEDSAVFQEQLYSIFLHAVSHVTSSLVDHLERSMVFGTESSETATKNVLKKEDASSDSFSDDIGNVHNIQNKFVHALNTLVCNPPTSLGLGQISSKSEALVPPKCKKIRASTLQASAQGSNQTRHADLLQEDNFSL